MEKQQYACEKCGNMHYALGQFQVTGGNSAKTFDTQNKKFIIVSCIQCGYTELYRNQASGGMNILDFLLGGDQSKANVSLHLFFCVRRKIGEKEVGPEAFNSESQVDTMISSVHASQQSIAIPRAVALLKAAL